MPINSIRTDITGESGLTPKFIYIDTTDTTLQITTPGYLDALERNGLQFQDDWMALVTYFTPGPIVVKRVGLFDVDEVGGKWSLIEYDPSSSSGVVGPGTTGKLSKFTSAEVVGDSGITENADEFSFDRPLQMYNSLSDPASVATGSLYWKSDTEELRIYNGTSYITLNEVSGPAGGDLSGVYPNPSVSAITTTLGPTSLAIGSVADGFFLQRSGSSIVGFDPSSFGYIDGSGTATKIALFSDSDTIADSGLTQNTNEVVFDRPIKAFSAAVNPPTTQEGSFYWKSDVDELRFYDGASWVTINASGISGSGTVGVIPEWGPSTTSLQNSGIVNSTNEYSFNKPIQMFSALVDPASTVEGAFYWKSDTDELRVYDGVGWTTVGGGGTDVKDLKVTVADTTAAFLDSKLVVSGLEISKVILNPAANEQLQLSINVGAVAGTVCAGDDVRLSDARIPTGAASGDLGGTYPGPSVAAITTTSGPTSLLIGAIADGFLLQRSGTSVIGIDPSTLSYIGGSGTTNLIPKFASSSSIADSIIKQHPSSNHIGINMGVADPAYPLIVAGTDGNVFPAANTGAAYVTADFTATFHKVDFPGTYDTRIMFVCNDTRKSVLHVGTSIGDGTAVDGGGVVEYDGPTKTVKFGPDLSPVGLVFPCDVTAITDKVELTTVNQFGLRIVPDSALAGSSNELGQLAVLSTDSTLNFYDGTQWVKLNQDYNLVAVSAFDTTPSYLEFKISATGGLIQNIINGGGNESLQLSVQYGQSANTVTQGDDSRIPSQPENDALQGTDGTPSILNKYVTNSDPRNTDPRTPTGLAGGDVTGSYPSSLIVSAITTTTGPTSLSIGAIADGESLRRSGASIIGYIPTDSDEKVKITASDTTPGFLDSKLVVLGSEIVKTILNPAADEDLQLSINVGTSPGSVAAGNDSRFPTADEKAALVGTGIPSAANVYVTNDDSRLSDSRIPTGPAGGDVTGSYPSSLVVSAITTTTGPTSLIIGAIADGQVLQRSGSTLIGVASTGTDEFVKVSSDDTTAAYLDTKIVTSGSELSIVVANPAANEALVLSANVGTTPGTLAAGDDSRFVTNAISGILTTNVLPVASGPQTLVDSGITQNTNEVTTDRPIQIFNSAADPASTALGSVYYDTDDNVLKYYNGTEYVPLLAEGDPVDLNSNYFDTFGRLSVAEPSKLMEYSANTPLDTIRYHSIQTASGGTVARNATSAQIEFTTTTASGSEAILQTRRNIQYNKGNAQEVYIIYRPNPLLNRRERWGYFDADNGSYFQHDGTTASIVIRSSATGTLQENVIPQSAWDDPLDGTGPSGLTIDWTKQTVFKIDIGWLSSRGARYTIDVNGTLVPVLKYYISNALTLPFYRTNNLPVRFEVTNTAVTSQAQTSSFTCFAVQTSGAPSQQGPLRTLGDVAGSPTAYTTTEEVVFGLRLGASFLNGSIQPLEYSILPDTGVSGILAYRIYYNPTLTGGTWTTAPEGIYENLTVMPTAFSGGSLLDAGFIDIGGNSAVYQSRVQGVSSDVYIGRAIDNTRDPLVVTLQGIGVTGSAYVTGRIREFL